MDAQAIINFISTLGFPITVCLVCFWYINKQQERHKEETDKLAEALNNNTIVMQKLVDKLNGGDI